MVSRHLALGCVFVAVALPAAAADATDRAALEALITKHAKANGVPVSLVHRVVRRESNYNPRASHRGNLGLMQIRHGTARSMGYTGSAAGLLDADTNLSYAVPYLANAYRVAGGNENRAVSLYASGLYDHATPKSMLAQVPAQPGLGSWLASVFSPLATEPQQAASVQVKEGPEDGAPAGRKRRSKWSHIAAAASSR
jgi:soluble lytic murein transglycosylase-like protein